MEKISFIKSPLKGKKYRAIIGSKHVDFGAIKPDGTPYEQYKDQIGLYSQYDHLDEN